VNMATGVHIRTSVDTPSQIQQRAALFVSALNAEGIAAVVERAPTSIPIPAVVEVMVGGKPS
jgi:hypothetical protein